MNLLKKKEKTESYHASNEFLKENKPTEESVLCRFFAFLTFMLLLHWKILLKIVVKQMAFQEFKNY